MGQEKAKHFLSGLETCLQVLALSGEHLQKDKKQVGCSRFADDECLSWRSPHGMLELVCAALHVSALKFMRRPRAKATRLRPAGMLEHPIPSDGLTVSQSARVQPSQCFTCPVRWLVGKGASAGCADVAHQEEHTKPAPCMHRQAAQPAARGRKALLAQPACRRAGRQTLIARFLSCAHTWHAEACARTRRQDSVLEAHFQPNCLQATMLPLSASYTFHDSGHAR